VSTRFQNLPPNITFTPQSLRLEFYGTEDFLAAVGALVYALQNDYQAISAFIESGTLVEAMACVTVPFPDAVPFVIKR
jgi:hypothetical protein